jgi:hypothetical protein
VAATSSSGASTTPGMPSRRSSPCQRNRRRPPDARALPAAAMSTRGGRHRLSARLLHLTQDTLQRRTAFGPGTSAASTRLVW